MPATHDRGDWFDALAKVELHLHLEGAIPLEALWQLVCRHGAEAEVGSLEAMRERFVFRDFAHFIQMWCWKNQYLKTTDDFELIAEAVAADLRQQNVLYAEVFFSPADFVAQHGLERRPIARAIRAGLDRVEGIEIALVADLVRDHGLESAERSLEELAPVCGELGIVGVGNGGLEAENPPEPFAPIYRRARDLGLRTSAHAGEAAGAESIWGAIRALAVERIGHGTRATEDPALVDYLREHQLPLEMCPLSNVATKVVGSLEEHPIRAFLEQGLLVTVNTDDPMMFGNSLAGELRQLHALGLSRAQILELRDNAVTASWLDDAAKQALRVRMADA